MACREDVVALVPLTMLLVVLLAVAVGTTAVRRSPPSRETAVAAGSAHATAAALLAILLGFTAAVYVGTAAVGNSSPGGLGRTALLIPLAFGVVHTLVLAVGELTWPRPEGNVRRARLVHRGLLDAAPRWLVRAAGAAIAISVVTLVAGALLADADGRSVTYRAGDGAGAVASTASPFPGLFYGVPAAVGQLLLTVLAAATLWIVANRPAVATSDENIEAALRRASTHRVLRAAVGVPLVVSGGLLFAGGGSLHAVASSGVASGLLDVAGGAASLVGGAAMLAGVVIACIPAPGVPADAPAVPAG
jgi:hypothetical protein